MIMPVQNFDDEINLIQQGEELPELRGYQTVKHTLDFFVALIVLLVLLPLMGLLALLICLESRGPAVYRQTRVGQFNEQFTIYKFRSMKVDTLELSTEEMQRQKLSPFTRLGPFLRKSNLDELPQIFNILKGEMSFVGPRPALLSQKDVNELRHEMGVEMARPGITGLAQINGRDDLDTPTKVNYDAQYCSSMSLALDAQILGRTVGAVISARGNK
jgi:lipopolysaccharide/colanic/teichoic acid biosynthesis glycosyltransferase